MTALWVAGHLSGGLGNRLFQHAAAEGLAKKTGRQLVFHLPSCAPTNHGPFDNIFKLFPTIPVIQDEGNILLLKEPDGGVFTYHPFPDLSAESRNLVVDGWRQSALYFPGGIHPALQEAIPNARKSELIDRFGFSSNEMKLNTWFVHVRLGDYLILPHHQIDLGMYYSMARTYIQPGSNIFIFSDQAKEYSQLLQNLFQGYGNVTVVTDVENELETLFLMSQCWKGAIVANSTFSWWGSYLAREQCPLIHRDRYIGLFPSCWGKGLPEARDIIPSWGIRIKNS